MWCIYFVLFFLLKKFDNIFNIKYDNECNIFFLNIFVMYRFIFVVWLGGVGSVLLFIGEVGWGDVGVVLG